MPGRVLEQEVRVRFAIRPDRSARSTAAPPSRAVELDHRDGLPVGAVGVLADPWGAPHGADGRDLLRRAGLAHLRVDVVPGVDEGIPWLPQLDLARELRLPVELAVHAAPHASGSEVLQVIDDLADLPLKRVLVLPWQAAPGQPEEVTPAPIVEAARTALHAVRPGVPVGGGSDAHFCELNRWRPTPFDLVAFPIVAQEHASDDLSLVETHEVLGDVVETCRSFCGDARIVVSPVTLRRRTPTVPPSKGPDPAADPRQHTRFGAAWLLGEVGALLGAGVDSVTACTTGGGRGVLSTGAAGAQSAPALAVLAQLAALRGWRTVRVAGPNPLCTAAFAATDGATTRMLLADLTGTDGEQLVVPGVSTASVLDGSSWREIPAPPGGHIRLPAHRIVRIDVESAPTGACTSSERSPT